MVVRLPTPGQDDGIWGHILNDFLSQIHNIDGTLKDGVITKAKLSSSVQSSLDNADAAIAGSVPDASTSVKGKLRLAGDLAGTADAPTVPGLASKASTAHQSTHQTGGSDALSGNLNANARVAISRGGVSIGTRRQLNLIEGTNVTITTTDDNVGEKVDVTINAASPGISPTGSPANGSLAVYNGSSWVILGRGQTGQILISTSTNIAWQTASTSLNPTVSDSTVVPAMSYVGRFITDSTASGNAGAGDGRVLFGNPNSGTLINYPAVFIGANTTVRDAIILPSAGDIFVYSSDGVTHNGQFDVYDASIGDWVTGSASGGSTDVGQAKALSTKTTNYTLTDSDEIILADATSSAFTVTLPTAVGRTRRKFVIKRINSGSNAVTVQAQAGQTIDGGNTASLSTQYTSITVVSDGANWLII